MIIYNKKLYVAVGFELLVALMCVTQHYDGTIFRDITIAIAGLFLGSQAYVDGKLQNVTPKQGG